MVRLGTSCLSAIIIVGSCWATLSSWENISTLQHAIYKSTKLLKLKETQSVAQSMKKWWKFMLNDRNKEAKLNMACRRIYSYFSALAKANTNQVFSHENTLVICS